MAPHVQTYQYGHSPCSPGLSVGIARHLPRGVKKSDYQRKGYFDVWLPLLAPSAELVTGYRHGGLTFRTFAARYRAEMSGPEPKQVIRFLAATARAIPIRLGCFCAEEHLCHRSILRELVAKAAHELPPPARNQKTPSLVSPPCSMPEIET